MTQPSIKGVAFQSVVEDIQRLRKEGRIGEPEFETLLKPGDIAHLDEVVQPSLWYPVDVYGRCLDLLCTVEGEGRSSYLVMRGVKAAERMMAIGAYRHFLSAADRWGQRAGEAMSQLATAMYNFMEWVIQHDEAAGISVLEVKGAADLPDAARHTVQGFIEVLFSRIGGTPVLVSSRRPKPDLVVYEIRRR
jgi:hypothetical protein